LRHGASAICDSAHQRFIYDGEKGQGKDKTNGIGRQRLSSKLESHDKFFKKRNPTFQTVKSSSKM
jgi:hypothetical protein